MSDAVWENTVDGGTWLTRVDRTGNYTGVLTVTRASDNLEILRKDVTLSYEAIFGPDVADVALWQELCIEAIDGFTE